MFMFSECLEGFESQVLKGGIINDTNPSATYTLEFPPEEDKLITGACFHHGRFIQSMRNCARKELKFVYCMYCNISYILKYLI